MSIVGLGFHNRLPIVLLPYEFSSRMSIIQTAMGMMLLTVSLNRSQSFCEDNFKKKSKYSLAGSRQSNPPSDTPGKLVDNCFCFSRSSIVSLWPRFFGLRSIRTDLFDLHEIYDL